MTKTNISRKIYGPPGTGKTTRLMKTIKAAVRSGIPISRIAFISLTRKAINEAKDRAKVAMDSMNVEYTDQDFTYFSTMHSFATRVGNIDGERLMKLEDYEEVRGRMAPHYPSYRRNPIAYFASGDHSKSSAKFQDADDGSEKLMFSADACIVQKSNLTGRSVRDLLEEDYIINGWTDAWFESHVKRIRNLQSQIEGHKARNSKMEFADVVKYFVASGYEDAPDFDIIFIDEAQDLDPDQWKIVEQLRSKTNRLIVAGDPDQSIFRSLSCSDTECFDGFKVDKEVLLTKSYRIPLSHHKAAQAMIRNFKHRQKDFQYDSKPEDGKLDFAHQFGSSFGLIYNVSINSKVVNTVDNLTKAHAISKGHEDKLVKDWMKAITIAEVGNGSYVLKRFEDIKFTGSLKQCKDKENDILRKFTKEAKSVVSVSAQQDILDEHESAMKTITDAVQKGKTVLITSLYNYPLEDIRNKLNMAGIEYTYGNHQHDDALVRVANVYKSKGGEADVVIFIDTISEIALKVHEFYPQDIYRLYYVALTRAKEHLSIFRYNGEGSYPILNSDMKATV